MGVLVRTCRAAAVLLAGGMAFLVAIKYWPVAEPQPVWSSGQGPVPRDFHVMMFPKSEDVLLHASPNGAVVGKLSRAVVNTYEEIEAGGWVQVVDKDGAFWVRLDDLVYALGPGQTSKLAEACEARYAERTKSEFGSMHLEHGPLPSGAAHFRLVMRSDDDHENVFAYDVRDNGKAIQPLEMYKQFGPGEAFGEGIKAIAIGLGSAIAAMGIAWGLIRLVTRSARCASRASAVV